MRSDEILMWGRQTEEIRRATEIVCCAFVMVAIAAKKFVGLKLKIN
jgi:hypothetical protein